MEGLKMENDGSLNRAEAEARLTPEQLTERDVEFNEIDSAHEASLAALSPELKAQRDELESAVMTAWKETQDDRFQKVASDANAAEFEELSQKHTEAQQALQEWDIKNLK